MFCSKNCAKGREYYFFKGWHHFRVHLKYICIKSHISTNKQCAGTITNRADNNLNVQMVLLHLESWTSQWNLRFEESSVMNLDDSILTSWASFHYISASVVYSVFKWLYRKIIPKNNIKDCKILQFWFKVNQFFLIILFPGKVDIILRSPT